MAKINVLEKHVAELIAAGEVVERPSSAVKELVENAIDANASAITVEIKNGGKSYIRVTDNGIGINSEDVRNAFKSHATSKIVDEQDLDSIGTLGFRGEALASIAAVSKIELITCRQGDNFGTKYEIIGGEELLFEEAGCPKGTSIIVKDLFFNTPARMKFLKKDVSEANAAAGIVDKLALSHPNISFRFIRDGKEQLLTPGDGKLLSTIYAVFGKEFADSLIYVSYKLNGIEAYGYISKPSSGRGSRSMQHFFINGRYVKTRTAMAALEESYKNAIMVGKFPACVLHLEVPKHSVDVNVHPAKIEIRFQNEKLIFDAVYYACKSAIQKRDTVKTIVFDQPQKPERRINDYEQLKIGRGNVQTYSFTEADKTSKSLENYGKASFENSSKAEKPISFTQSGAEKAKNDDFKAEILFDNQPVFDTNASKLTDEANAPQDAAYISDNNTAQTDRDEGVNCKVLGEAFNTYIIAEYLDEIMVIDKHAAHERMIFEQLKKDHKSNYQQLTIKSLTVTLSKEEYSEMITSADILKEAGFVVEDFGPGTVSVRETPMALENEDITSIIQEIAEYLLKNKKNVFPEKLDWIFHSVACRAAIKAGDNISKYEMNKFVEKLLANPEIRHCPHGRPVMIKLTKREIEKQFGRG